jgi:hypothetical protein
VPAKTADATTAVTDAFVNTIKQSQELATTGLTAWIDLAGKTFATPSFDALPFADAMPNPREVIDVSFGFAEELLATQKELAVKLVDAVAPLASKAVKTA